MPSAATNAEPELGTPLDVIRYFIDAAHARGHHPIVADIAIGHFGRKMARWAGRQRELDGTEPSAEALAAWVRTTPPQDYRDLLERSFDEFAAAATELMHDRIEQAREVGDDDRLQIAAAAARAFLTHHETGKFDSLFARVDAMDDERRLQATLGARVERFVTGVANGVAVTIVVALIVVATIVILGGETGVRALLGRVLDAASP